MKTLLVAVVGLAALSFVSVSTSAFAQTKPAPKAPVPKATASAVQKITVKVDGIYSPSDITVKAGKPGMCQGV